MRILDFGPEGGRRIAESAHGSRGLTIWPSLPLARGEPVQVAAFRLGPGGRIGRHEATVPQLLAVVEGSGWVSGADGVRHAVTAGRAASWVAGEEH